MLNQILAKLVAKYPGLPKSFLGLVAAQLATKVTEESGIDQAITDYDNAAPIQTLATEFQKEGDRRVNDAKKEWEKKNPAKPADPANPEPAKPDPVKPADEMPTWAKALQDQIATLTKEKAQTSIKSKLDLRMKDKVPESYYSLAALPEKEEDLEEFATKLEAKYTAFKQEQINAGLMTAGKPAGSSTTVVTAGKEEADIEAWAGKGAKPAETKK